MSWKQQTAMKTFISAYLQKRESDRRWIEYWVIVRGSYMVFYSQKCEGERNYLRGFIEISPKTKCLITERRKYHFPFFVATDRAKYYFKCSSAVRRHDWIRAIGSACKEILDAYPSALENFGADRSPEHIPETSPLQVPSGSDDSTDSEQVVVQHSDTPSRPIEEDTDHDDGRHDVIPGVIIVEGTNHNIPKTRFILGEGADPRLDETAPYGKDRIPSGLNQSPPVSRTIPRPHHLTFLVQKPRTNTLNFDNLSVTSVLPRPSTSPERPPTTTLSGLPVRGVGKSFNTMTFSRHLVASAPDLQTLVVEDF